jgi:hypothetical protein
MKAAELQNKINHLKQVRSQFSDTENEMIGVTIIRVNSSDNWLFNSEVDLESIVPTITQALSKDIEFLESQLPPLIAAEAEEAAIMAEQEAIRVAQETEELARQQAEDNLISRITLGKKTIMRYLLENETIEMTIEQSLALASSQLKVLQTLLEAGQITKSRSLIQSMPDNLFPVVEPYKTEAERKQSFIDELTL